MEFVSTLLEYKAGEYLVTGFLFAGGAVATLAALPYVLGFTIAQPFKLIRKTCRVTARLLDEPPSKEGPLAR
jgi:hypothetical protein